MRGQLLFMKILPFMIGDRDTNQVWKGLKYLMRMYVTMLTF